jgi:uncharacterized repeat protein (TIGR01451 family)
MTVGLVFVLAAGILRAEENPEAGPLVRQPVDLLEPPPADGPPPVPLRPAFHEPKDPPFPAVAIRVRVPACVASQKDLKYLIYVENHSHVCAHHVLVRNPIPANAKFVNAIPTPLTRAPELRWDLGTLKPGECRDIILVLKPIGEGEVKNCARVQFEHGQCVCTKVGPHGAGLKGPPRRPGREPGLRLRKNGPAQAILNETLTYELTVTNTGDKELTGIKVTDTLPDGLEHATKKKVLTWDIETLAAGESRTIEYRVVAKKKGRLCNEAVAVAGKLTGKARGCVLVGEANMTLTKTGPKRQYVNLPATYFLTVRNTGTIPLGNVAISDPLPAQTTFVRADNGGRLVNNEVQWVISTLEPGSSRTVEIALKAQAAGVVRNQATATADHGLSAKAEAITEFRGESALLVELVKRADPVEVDSETSYIITIQNQGMVPATNIEIKALIPNEMALVRARGPADNRLGERTKEGQILLFDPLKTLAVDATARYEIFARAQRPGDIRLKVEVTADQLKAGGPVHEEESTTIYSDIAPVPRE